MNGSLYPAVALAPARAEPAAVHLAVQAAAWLSVARAQPGTPIRPVVTSPEPSGTPRPLARIPHMVTVVHDRANRDAVMWELTSPAAVRQPSTDATSPPQMVGGDVK